MNAVQPMPVRSPGTRADAWAGAAGSSLEPLPRFSFAVAMSRGQDDVAVAADRAVADLPARLFASHAAIAKAAA